MIDSVKKEYTCMIYKIYAFQYEANQYLYGLGKGHQHYDKTILLRPGERKLNGLKINGNKIAQFDSVSTIIPCPVFPVIAQLSL